MATTTTAAPGKTSFVKEFLQGNPQANAKAVNEAWTAAGMKGTISHPIISQVRKQLGLTGNLPGKTRNTAKEKAASNMPRTATAAPGKTSFVKEFLNDQSPRQHQSRERGLAGCRVRWDDQPHPRQQDESGADRQSAWEAQNSRQGEGSLQHAQDGNRYSRQDHLRERVPPRQSPRQRQSRERGVAGCRIRRDHQHTLVYKTRASLGLTGNLSGKTKRSAEGKATPTGKKRGRPRKEPTAAVTGQPRDRRAAHPTERPGSRNRPADFQGDGVGDLTEIEDTLRQARRLLYGASTGG